MARTWRLWICSFLAVCPLALVDCLALRANQSGSPLVETVRIPKGHVRRVRLSGGQTVEISVRVNEPSQLPDNGRLRVSWSLASADNPARIPRAPQQSDGAGRSVDAFGIPTAPTANWSKLLHALDADLYVIYQAPAYGVYELTIAPESGEVTLFDGPRWREEGSAPQSTPVPRVVAWPDDASIDVSLLVNTIDISSASDDRLVIEAEPNDTPEQSQLIRLADTRDEHTLNVVGTSDDIEYFDNGRVGSSGDDWFRIEYTGQKARLLTACLSIPDQQVAAQIRAYHIPPDDVQTGRARSMTGQLLPLEVYEDGKNPNERSHGQPETDPNRSAINRVVEPGGVYFLRVEANAPFYDLELRMVEPAPYDDPRRAIRQGLYDHVGQVDAWLTNRPRGASVGRRVRDSGNLLGTNCMSCHTQSGVWGPAVPLAQGYRPQNLQHWRHLINTCYQSMRPTNELVDGAVNTSLQPLDLGDGPAGTRVAGHSVVALERALPPRQLHSKQALRAANYVLQTADPGGINAAGPGANVGEGVVYNYAGEILAAAWQQSAQPKFFHALVERAHRLLRMEPKYADDLAHRVEYLQRYLPPDHVAIAERLADHQPPDESQKDESQKDNSQKDYIVALPRQLDEQIRRQVDEDLARLRAIQLEDGGWSFDPGKKSEDGVDWIVEDTNPDPSPTALALIAFQAAGIDQSDPTVKRGIRALLNQQHPTGFWNGNSETGFVSTSYALHALARYFPAELQHNAAHQFQPRDGESLIEAIARARRLSMTEDPRLVPQLEEAAAHESPLVRVWAMIGLGWVRSNEAIEPLVQGLGDRTKVVRESAHWGLRQHLIDNRGWDHVLAAATSGDDFTRAAAIRALVMKVDGVLPEISVNWQQLAGLFDRALNDDPHPAVRAWATRAAWQWWVWNPPIRPTLNQAWARLIGREEPNALVENAIRYQSHALFIANGHVANASEKHQYQELKDLFARLQTTLDQATSDGNDRLARRITSRLVAVAATFYFQRGGDGGPGQLGYSTPGAGDLFGAALLFQLKLAESLAEGDARTLLTKIVLEGAANVPLEALQDRLVEYWLEGPEDLRVLAAASISDPRIVSLPAVAERLEPMHRQLLRGAAEPARRESLSDPILKMIGGVRWELPDSHEGRQNILKYFVPDLSVWQSEDTINAMTDFAGKQRASRDADTAWYLAEGLGTAIEKNPDLHFQQIAEAFPHTFPNHAVARFWIRSVPWLLTFKRPLPDVKIDPTEPVPVDPFEELRSRALRLFLTQLEKEALSPNRRLAAELSNQTALRSNPEVLTTLAKLELGGFENDDYVLELAQNVLSMERGMFGKQLADAVAQETDHPFNLDNDGAPVLPEDFVEDVTYFRDYVVPEMTSVLRGDERSCMICHGEPGRVPSMELHRPDNVGYLPVDQLLANYRILQERINIGDVERSKLLRKPLNVQSGKEDGHQGGRRYQPNDDGYQILRKWALNQVEVQAKYNR